MMKKKPIAKKKSTVKKKHAAGDHYKLSYANCKLFVLGHTGEEVTTEVIKAVQLLIGVAPDVKEYIERYLAGDRLPYALEKAVKQGECIY